MNAYDFDKTIYDGDSTADFYLFCLKRHKKIILLAPSLIAAFLRFYVLKKGTKTEFKEVMYRFFKFCDIDKDLKDFWSIHKNKIKPFYYKQQKIDDVIISASPEFLLKPICTELGINTLIASLVDSKTGKYYGVNCHGEEKVKRLYEFFSKEIEIDKFYSDSYSDTPMAEIANKAYLVKQDKLSVWKFNK